jgi:dTDP-4-dehydrorhamnose reductase
MPEFPTTWITGGGGLIGGYLARSAAQFAPGWQVIPLTRGELDLTDAAAVRTRFRREQPKLVIHCAALSRSPACQADPALARQLNIEVTARLTDLAAESRLVLFSSDLVFDGRKGSAYVEADATNPLSIYGETKVAAERLVLANPRHLVVRTSLNGGASPAGDRGFNEELRRAWQAGQVPKLFVDEFRCPIPAAATARAIWELALSDCAGLYHVAGSERLSRWDMGRLVAERCPELQPRFEAASVKDYRGAPRPQDTSLDCGKAQAVLSFPLPALSGWLAENSAEAF